jgi:hypothetical protein
LRIDVLQSADLCRKIEGWVRAATAVTPAPLTSQSGQIPNLVRLPGEDSNLR